MATDIRVQDRTVLGSECDCPISVAANPVHIVVAERIQSRYVFDLSLQRSCGPEERRSDKGAATNPVARHGSPELYYQRSAPGRLSAGR